VFISLNLSPAAEDEPNRSPSEASPDDEEAAREKISRAN
jgi:hypothetical protein